MCGRFTSCPTWSEIVRLDWITEARSGLRSIFVPGSMSRPYWEQNIYLLLALPTTTSVVIAVARISLEPGLVATALT